MATAVAYPCADAHGFSEHDLTDMLSFFEKEHDNSLLNQQVDPPGETSLDGSSDAAPKQEQSGTSSPVLVAPSYCGMIAPQIQRTFTGHSLLLGHNGAVLGVVPHPASEYSMGLQQAMPNSAAGKGERSIMPSCPVAPRSGRSAFCIALWRFFSVKCKTVCLALQTPS